MARYYIDNVPAPIQWEKKDPLHRTLQNAKNLLMARMGEIPYDRFRGFDPGIYDLPIGQMQEMLMPEVDRVLLWEPNAEAEEAKCERDENGETIILVTVEVPFE